MALKDNHLVRAAFGPPVNCPDCDRGICRRGQIVYECPSCNGTGIKGNPGCLAVLLVLAVAIMGAVILFAMFPL
jgi:ribosomal protein L37AE/L43A